MASEGYFPEKFIYRVLRPITDRLSAVSLVGYKDEVYSPENFAYKIIDKNPVVLMLTAVAIGVLPVKIGENGKTRWFWGSDLATAI